MKNQWNNLDLNWKNNWDLETCRKSLKNLDFFFAEYSPLEIADVSPLAKRQKMDGVVNSGEIQPISGLIQGTNIKVLRNKSQTSSKYFLNLTISQNFPAAI